MASYNLSIILAPVYYLELHILFCCNELSENSFLIIDSSICSIIANIYISWDM